MYVGNYDFWYESSQLVQQLIRNKNKRNAEKIAELQAVYPAFLRQQSQEQTGHRPPPSAGQADAWRRCPAPSRRYPFVGFTPGAGDRQGRALCRRTSRKTVDGVQLLDKVSFIVEPRMTRSPSSARTRSRRRPCSRSSWASWSRMRARSSGASPRQPELLPQGQHRVF